MCPHHVDTTYLSAYSDERLFTAFKHVRRLLHDRLVTKVLKDIELRFGRCDEIGYVHAHMKIIEEGFLYHTGHLQVPYCEFISQLRLSCFKQFEVVPETPTRPRKRRRKQCEVVRPSAKPSARDGSPPRGHAYADVDADFNKVTTAHTESPPSSSASPPMKDQVQKKNKAGPKRNPTQPLRRIRDEYIEAVPREVVPEHPTQPRTRTLDEYIVQVGTAGLNRRSQSQSSYSSSYSPSERRLPEDL